MRKILELGSKGVQYATFPEAIVPYYPYFSFVQAPFRLGAEHVRLIEESVTVPSTVTEMLGDACRQAGMVVSIGINERDGGTVYNTQLLFDADGTLLQRRRKLTPTYHERIVWGQGDGSGLVAVDSAVGRIGQLACWEHYLPLARYALMVEGEQIHSAMYPGSFGGASLVNLPGLNLSTPRSVGGALPTPVTGKASYLSGSLAGSMLGALGPQTLLDNLPASLQPSSTLFYYSPQAEDLTLQQAALQQTGQASFVNGLSYDSKTGMSVTGQEKAIL
ncbi:hypothetical protein R8871_06409 [Paraburkholderia graminis C4D1M]|uniref:Nitrilase/cyanide hydratase and apolipoprotein N-acyltransferase n=1 Tax=Paraburkholderia graminis (strain ATCC 700544 / DSM 17151 / LMG 18924 / NCIMB 13744 / C4D1M) TaxID=396598 RepID=B1FYH8_PARG4|nr:Nitrilase/cyanide hydratase and apolipoprotein N-acyltransferase [Paraburkholderia graminis C4D1M]CAB3738417.1 hypothetical protein R8871_06409 [Paraburkholderia graminis C4D1M]